ncbi:uncharacterized protein BJ171DRAFT_473652 [Polychytrium aggregatum]|uniref:uncharacterized protein n=1 Tax=Polychytrium aggregatum TaxID=110093 RepID=UPI0022FF24AA|nr:uncharacterized protein BJ171DRAFT_473652 [Polychytrium aggregatum]KAI9206132.1 hypothetical protein BJ171DRAFT_473652 [Polychytrium aggregatum]
MAAHEARETYEQESDLRILFDSLSQRIRQKEHEYLELRQGFKTLQDDFMYNLSLLEDRDRELEVYEQQIQDMKADLSDREAVESELKITIAEKSAELLNLKSLVQTQEQHHREALRGLRKEHEGMGTWIDLCMLRRLHASLSTQTVARAYDDRIRSLNETIELLKVEQDSELREIRHNIEAQRQTWSDEVDHYKHDLDLEAEACRHEMELEKIKLQDQITELQGQLDLEKEAREAGQQRYQQQGELLREHERTIKRYQWELGDAKKSLAKTQTDLEGQLEELRTKHQNALLVFEERQAHILREADERDQSHHQQKRAMQEKHERLLLRCADLEQTIESLKQDHEQQRLLNHEQADKATKTNAELEETIARLTRDMKEAAKAAENEIYTKTQELKSQSEIIAIYDQERAERRKDLEAYKSEVARLIDSEQALKRELLEKELLFERRVEDAKMQAASEHEQVVRSLMQAKERSEAQIKLLRGRIKSISSSQTIHSDPHKDDTAFSGLRSARSDFEDAPASVDSAGAGYIPRQAPFNPNSVADERASDLKDSKLQGLMVESIVRQSPEPQPTLNCFFGNQNDRLVSVIKEMRRDMEALQEMVEDHQTAKTDVGVYISRIEQLQEQVARLSCRQANKQDRPGRTDARGDGLVGSQRQSRRRQSRDAYAYQPRSPSSDSEEIWRIKKPQQDPPSE